MSAPATPRSPMAQSEGVPPSIASAPIIDGRLWTDQEEYLLSLWADRALCYKLIHEESEGMHRRHHKWFSIPVIVLSTLTGTANVAISAYVPAAYTSIAQLIIGCVNLFAGVLSTLQNYFRSAEKVEAHRHAAVSWGKIYRSIYVELSLAREKRKPIAEFLRISKTEYDRLIDSSPIVKKSIYSKFGDRAANNPSINFLFV